MAETIVALQASTLAATFESAGTATDPTLPVVLTITPVAGGAAVVTATTADETVEHPSDGVFTYEWTPDDVAESTEYLAVWNPGGSDTSATEIITVLPAYEGTWSTVAQVLALTGTTVTTAQLVQASAVIDTYAGVTTDMPADAITAKDRAHLRKATGWQAAWQASRPGFFTQREAHTAQSADSVSVQREAPSDLMLAPMAKRELANLSWYGTRTTVVPKAGSTRGVHCVIDFLNEKSDEHCGTWRPL